MPEVHNARVDKTDEHDRHGRRGLDGDGDACTEGKALEGVGGHLLEQTLKLTAGKLFKTLRHDLHAVEEKRKTAEQSEDAEDAKRGGGVLKAHSVLLRYL